MTHHVLKCTRGVSHEHNVVQNMGGKCPGGKSPGGKCPFLLGHFPPKNFFLRIFKFSIFPLIIHVSNQLLTAEHFKIENRSTKGKILQ